MCSSGRPLQGGGIQPLTNSGHIHRNAGADFVALCQLKLRLEFTLLGALAQGFHVRAQFGRGILQTIQQTLRLFGKLRIAMCRRLAQPIHTLINILLAASALNAQHAELYLRLAMSGLGGLGEPFAGSGGVASHAVSQQISAGQIDLCLNHASLGGLGE